MQIVDSARPSAPETFREMFDRIFAEAAALMARKQADYGPGNIAAFGETGCVVRATDKLARLQTLVMGAKQPSNESIEDSWTDLLNYAAIGLAVHRGWWTKDHCPPLV